MRAELSFVDLNGSDLTEADLSDARLDNADLTGAILYSARLRGATYNAQTRWPKGFDPVAAGAILEH